MDTLGVTIQGVVNQASKTSTQNTGATEKQNSTRNQAADTNFTEYATAELKKRVDQILGELQAQGVQLAPSKSPKAEKPETSTPVKADYIDLLRNVLIGNSTDAKVLPKATLGDGLPISPFDKTILQVNLEYLRSLLSPDAYLDKQLTQRIEQQLANLKDTVQSTPAETESAAVPAPATLDKTV